MLGLAEAVKRFDLDKDVKFIITRGGQEISIKDLKEWEL